jgi:uncharacterized membrane protein YphA (DoxX/SURF4 family)
MTKSLKQEEIITLFLRYALAIAFLSAVADRFGFWGTAGSSNVGWGDFDAFMAYVQVLNPYLSVSLISPVAWIATLAEVILALFLMTGLFLRQTAWLSGMLLLLFALAMTFNLGIKAPFDYSVFTASAASFLLYLHVKQ